VDSYQRQRDERDGVGRPELDGVPATSMQATIEAQKLYVHNVDGVAGQGRETCPAGLRKSGGCIAG